MKIKIYWDITTILTLTRKLDIEIVDLPKIKNGELMIANARKLLIKKFAEEKSNSYFIKNIMMVTRASDDLVLYDCKKNWQNISKILRPFVMMDVKGVDLK